MILLNFTVNKHDIKNDSSRWIPLTTVIGKKFTFCLRFLGYKYQKV